MVVSGADSVIAGLDPIFQANSVAWPIARMTSQLELMMGSPVSGFHLAIAGSALQAGNAVGRGRSQAGKSQFWRKKAFSGSRILKSYPPLGCEKYFNTSRFSFKAKLQIECKCIPLFIWAKKCLLLNFPWNWKIKVCWQKCTRCKKNNTRLLSFVKL